MESLYNRNKTEFETIIQQIPISEPYMTICTLERSEFDNYQIIADHFKNIIEKRKQRHDVKTIGLIYYKMDNGGVEKVLSLLSDMLSKPGEGKAYKVVVITDQKPTPSDYSLPNSVIREVIPSYNICKGNYEIRGSALLNLIEKYDIDVFIDSLWAEPSVIWDMLTIKTSPKCPAFIIYTHTLYTFLWESRKHMVHAAWKMFPFADAIITLTDLDKKYWGIINKNTYKLYNPCVNNAKSQKNQWKEAPHHILWLGRISSEKQPFEIVNIMKRVVRELPNTICHIVGSEDKIIEEDLKAYIKENSLQKNFIMEGFHTDTDKFYRQADIFISTSRYEGFSMTFMEAASYGIPTVFYDLPWIQYNNIIEGFCKVPQMDTQKAADAVITLLSDREKWETSSNLIFNSFQKFIAHDLRKDWDEIFSNYKNNIHPVTAPVDNDIVIGLNRIIEIYDNDINNRVPENNPAKVELEMVYRSESWKIGQMIVQPLHAVKVKFEEMIRK